MDHDLIAKANYTNQTSCTIVLELAKSNNINSSTFKSCMCSYTGTSNPCGYYTYIPSSRPTCRKQS